MITSTKLLAVNAMLATIGEAPVSSTEYEEGVFSYASQAQLKLDEITIKTLSQGWNFNVHLMDLNPDIDGKISLPPDTLAVHSPEDTQVYLTDTNGHLYDPAARTDVFTSVIKVKVILGYSFDMLPSVLQMYILDKSKLSFREDIKGSNPQKDNVLLREIRESRTIAETWDSKVLRPRMTDNITHTKLINRNYRR